MSQAKAASHTGVTAQNASNNNQQPQYYKIMFGKRKTQEAYVTSKHKLSAHTQNNLQLYMHWNFV